MALIYIFRFLTLYLITFLGISLTIFNLDQLLFYGANLKIYLILTVLCVSIDQMVLFNVSFLIVF